MQELRMPYRKNKKKFTRGSIIASRQALPNIDCKEGSQSNLKQAIKKQIDRRSKLRKLLQTFIKIKEDDKKNSRFIKCSMIEIKDSMMIAKPKIEIDPRVFTANHLKIQYRQYLSTLINTFYHTYQKNQQTAQNIKSYIENLGYLIKSLSCKEDQIFSIHTYHIQNIAAQQNKNQTLTSQLKIVNSQNQRLNDELRPLESQHQILQKQTIEKKEQIKQLEQRLMRLKQRKMRVQQLKNRQQQRRKQLWDNFLQQKMYEEKIKFVLQKVDKDIDCGHKQYKNNTKKLVQIMTNSSINEQICNGKKIQNSSVIKLNSCDPLKKSRVSTYLNQNNSSTLTNNCSQFGMINFGQTIKSQIQFNVTKEFSLKKSGIRM